MNSLTARKILQKFPLIFFYPAVATSIHAHINHKINANHCLLPSFVRSLIEIHRSTQWLLQQKKVFKSRI